MVTKQTLKTRELAEMALFLAIIVILAFTPLGYIPLGIITPTTMHIPVIIAGIVLGPKKGAITGFMFGLTSFLKASFFAPTPTSFLFTPLQQGGNVFSLVICFLPRILLGVLAFYIYFGANKILKNKGLCFAIAGGLATLLHTIMVLGMAYIFFTEPYAVALEVSSDKVLLVLLGIVASNGIPEVIVATIVTTAVCTALDKAKRVM